MGSNKFGMGRSAERETDTGAMKYQYEQFIKQLLLLQDHAASRSCPYTPTGEMCIRKHLTAVEAYAQETIPMENDPDFRGRLESLESEAINLRLEQEAVLCGEREQGLEGLEHWARRWRKEFEPRALVCAEHESAEQKQPQPVPEAVAQ